MPDNPQPKNHDDTPIWGAAEIARAARLRDRGAAYNLLSRGLLPARRVGRRWVSSPSLLKQALTGGDRGGDGA